MAGGGGGGGNYSVYLPPDGSDELEYKSVIVVLNLRKYYLWPCKLGYEQVTCHRRFNGDVGDGWKSDADENALINVPCFVE